ncbi:MAG TPA: chemotaxis protein CheD [Gemmatimonadaceae bacterium]|nr:chemotaxis protein CheD [Gemmatimonadaceae bacterium]
MSQITVGVADYAVARGDVTLVTVGLGSCVAIVLHDPFTNVGGLAHILLPDETLSRDTANAAKFATTAVPLLLQEMKHLGARGEVVARIAGGAAMFRSLLASSGLNVGERNVDATRRVLHDAGVRLAGEDVGGEHGRSVYFSLRTGQVRVRSVMAGERVI